MSTVLLSIKPKYVSLILSGKKRYEYRTIKPNKLDIDKMVIYETSPKMRVVGEVEIKNILCDSSDEIWNKTRQYSGVERDHFDAYFKNKRQAVAYCLGKVTIYDKELTLKEIGVNYTPQSFIYLD